MILLEVDNKGVIELLQSRFETVKAGQKCDTIDFSMADFDGALYHVSNKGSRNIIRVSISLKFFKELQEFDVLGYLSRIYGTFLSTTTQQDYCVTLEYDLSKLPDNFVSLAEEAGMLRRHCFGAVFEQLFDFQAAQADLKSSTESKRAVIHFRDSETMYVQAMHDRVTVIFSTVFKDADDIVLSKVFLQELADTRRGFTRSPQVLFSHKNPPAELSGTDALRGDNVAYITFVLQPFHTSKENRQQSINLVHTVRNYLHYHIKCCKAHLHMRMRGKCSEWLKVLNRARPELQFQTGLLSAGGLGGDFSADDSTKLQQRGGRF